MACSTSKTIRKPRFSPMIKWWFDISLRFTQNTHYVLWQTLSPTLSYIHSSLVPRIRPIFRVRSPDPFLAVLTIFSLKSPPNLMVTPSQKSKEYSRLGGTAPKFDRFSWSDLQTRFWWFSSFFHPTRHRVWWWPHATSGRLLTTRRYCRFGRFSGSDRQTSFWRFSP